MKCNENRFGPQTIVKMFPYLFINATTFSDFSLQLWLLKIRFAFFFPSPAADEVSVRENYAFSFALNNSERGNFKFTACMSLA